MILVLASCGARSLSDLPAKDARLSDLNSAAVAGNASQMRNEAGPHKRDGSDNSMNPQAAVDGAYFAPDNTNYPQETREDAQDGATKLYVSNDSSRYDNVSYSEYEDPPTTEEILEYIYPKSWTWALIFFHCVVFVVGLVGNCLVCVAVYRNHTMRTVTNYFIVNLAVADFLVILFCLPPSVVWDVTSTWWFGTAMCKFVLYIQDAAKIAEMNVVHYQCLDVRHVSRVFIYKGKPKAGKAILGILYIFYYD
ncbi:hypothetical protein NQ318_023118 [Aromia moschata]|uniref:G-protein coupled receptors family 1 profile domain-containing protein n=1 Tax=Aromia moschata TaxID=1265417 RepID=A0AAV8XS10_9CUCU|nr:hypothetical protein NQ318_023118 [Aromia moschata]